MKTTYRRIVDEVRDVVDGKEFRRSLESLLMDMLAIDTSPAQPLDELARAEDRVFALVSGYLERLANLPGTPVRHAIRSGIDAHPFYSKVYSFPDHEEVPAGTAYKGRYNLLYLSRSEGNRQGRHVGLNAHIDVVSPYIPPSRSDTAISGRGSADDKGNVAVILGTLNVIDRLVGMQRVRPMANIAAFFVIDEELGGNGSLSVAMDHGLKKEFYDSLLVLECAGNKLYSGNRGAVFIKVEGAARPDTPVSPTSMLESCAFGIVGLTEEGLKIREESAHPQFPQRPVYTCTGILDGYGKHPSGICDLVEFDLICREPAEAVIAKQAIEDGLAVYIGIFGDKQCVRDPLTGRQKVMFHYELDEMTKTKFRVTVHGSGGHMGSLPENDAAITKWAYIISELVKAKARHGVQWEVLLPLSGHPGRLVFEGAQSFLPCHRISDITSRLNESFLRGIAEYSAVAARGEDSIDWKISFDKLHNEAFATDPDSVSMRTAVEAGKEAGIIPADEPLVGWDASCDARIFALEYPGLPVITSGPGDLNGAHSDKESLALEDLYDSIVFTVLYVLKETGALGGDGT